MSDAAEVDVTLEAARGILREPHGFRPKLVKSAAVLLADFDRVACGQTELDAFCANYREAKKRRLI
ncbi:hypothetical protein [Mesorhizobium sp. DCY119]|uniref:hypothetical protein n=1 Tax=Mesorhizobium sp. DCY119 TaxID=2108445 RepID=UPI0013C45D85|nr:hypothetical protein [Mesorhizobium sp. DCY119]